MARFLGIVAALMSLLLMMQFSAGRASADDAQNVSTYRQFIDAINKGDAAKALSFFADDAQLSGPSPLCFPSACNGRAAIQRQLEAEVSQLHLQLQLLSSVNVVNGNVTAQVAHRADPIRAAGLSRVVTNDTVTFRADKISKFTVDLSTSDPQSAVWGRLRTQPPAPAATQAPAVVPIPIVAIQAPNTGDGGLLGQTMD
jgi:ketosteroid isomerase-like protein